jgi:hypothetical protein
MAVPAALQSVVSFLRTGYPDGVPEQDYQPLLALLRRRLTLDEVREVAGVLRESGHPCTAEAICRAIEDVTHGEASDADVERVRTHLRDSGVAVE